MRLSKHLLYNWINCNIHFDTICKQITYSGLETEDIQNNINIFQKYLVIGKIIFSIQHPNSSLYMIYKVAISKEKILNIVSDNKFFCHHMKVVVAKIGSILSNNKIVQKENICGIISEGIICTYKHCNMFNKKNDVIELLDCAPIGINFQDYLFYKDQIIKVNVTPNRLDALGVFGIAREVAILNDFNMPNIANIPSPITIQEKCNLQVKISDTIYYTSRIIKNVNLNIKTPIWMKEKLRRCHINSVNIVIDIVNYIFLEFGKSLYVFSFLNTMHDIVLRFAEDSEKIFIKNKNTIILNKKIIVLSNKCSILSFLGNMDFKYFPIHLNHKNLFLGFLFVDPKTVYNSLYELKKKNPCIQNNEYYVDTTDQIKIIEYTTNLFLKICGGNVGPIVSYVSEDYHKYINKKITLNYKNIQRLTGCNIHYDIISKILKNLQYSIEYTCEQYWNIIPPTWRLDITIEEDVISDIIRIYQYSNIPIQPFYSTHNIISNNITENFLKRIKYLLIDLGYHEVINYSFIDPKIQNLIFPKNNFLFLNNPISIEMSCMRYSLLPGLIKNLSYHQNRQYEEVKFFESGLCFSSNPKKHLGVKQDLYLSGIIGNIGDKKNWFFSARKFDFYDLKGDIESIFDILGYLENIEFKKISSRILHPEQNFGIFLNNQYIGFFGALHPSLLKSFNLQYSVFLFELFWDFIIFRDFNKIKKISEFPHSRRDISILMNEDIEVNEIILFCKKKFIDLLSEIRIFDIYRGHTIPNGQKSISLTFIFQSIEKTLTDQEIDNMMSFYLQGIKKKFGASLRKI
ncbi:phenylalanine--tRNA ligase subunit beta [Buchnera aphidicola]|uniref:phenylalanine--tRNA ligase subunit beta n=1 Tax=Buchnera aphidicola TaxID=9 RepID=UPI0034649A66